MVLKSQTENATIAAVEIFLLYVDNLKLISEQLQTAEP